MPFERESVVCLKSPTGYGCWPTLHEPRITESLQTFADPPLVAERLTAECDARFAYVCGGSWCYVE